MVEEEEATEFDFSKIELHNSPVFGAEITPIEVDYRWHMGADMATIKRRGFLKLCQIRVRGSLTYGLSGLQLIFEHGVTSPVIDASRPGADQFKTVDLPEGAVISKIIMREFWPNFNGLSLAYADGTEQTICSYHPSGNDRTLHVP